MDLRQIRYFQCVARELSFTRAAERLHMAQPPLSRQIKALEEDLGVALFERAGRGISLTDAGRFFLDQTEALVQKLEDIVVATQRVGRHEKRWVGLGFVPSVLYGYMPEFIRRLRSLDEQVEIGLAEMTTLQQFEALKSGRIDIGLGRVLLEDDEIERLVLWEERLIVALPAGHPLAGRQAIGLDDILPQPLILYPARPRPSYADQLLDLFRRHGIQPRVEKEVNELQTAIGLVAAGIGLAIVPESVRGLHREEVRYVRLDAPDFVSPILLSWRRNDGSAFLREAVLLARGIAAGRG